MKPKTILVTFPLDVVVSDLLGNQEYVTISERTAECFLLAIQHNNLHNIHIQFPSDKDNVDILGQAITQPILWRLGAWQNSTERWLRAKQRSEQERQERIIFDENVRIVRRAILKFAQVTDNMALMIATKCVRDRNYNKIKVFGVHKLIQKMEEI